jgi:DNA-binding SARP family transcriptional activator
MELLREDGSSVLSVLAQPKRAALLAYLALAEPRGFHRRDKLKALFWPESDAEHARGSLNKAVHFLRGSLGEEAVVNRGVAELGLDWEQVWCGCRAFSTAVSEENWEQALELYRGELLEGFHLSGCPKFQGWLDEERERYRELAAKAAWSRSHQYLEAGEPGDAEQMAQRALGLLYTDESEVRRFITALAHVGDRAAAVRFYGKFEEKLGPGTVCGDTGNPSWNQGYRDRRIQFGHRKRGTPLNRALPRRAGGNSTRRTVETGNLGREPGPPAG